MRLLRFVPLLPALLVVSACSSDDDKGLSDPVNGEPDAGLPGTDASDASTPPDAAEEPKCEPGEPAATPIDLGAAPAVIITSAALEPAFQPLAALHSLLGIPTDVVTVEQICSAAGAGACDDSTPAKDTAKAIKAWITQYSSLRYVLLGGDIEVVPSRKVHDTYKNPFASSYTYDEAFFTDYYYADASEWDSNADGLYAQDGSDSPDYRPERAVSRIPASTAAEVELYYQKVLHHLTKYNLAHVSECMLLSNVATEFSGIDIDGALYFEAEGKTSSLLPTGCSVRKMYATSLAGAEKTTAAGQLSAFEQGYNLMVHNGHGSVSKLTVEYSGAEPVSGAMVSGLKNTTLPIYLSCACEAGTFSAKDSAGELLMNAAQGGAIAYLGNTVIGLGLAGGVQLIDEMLRYIQVTPRPLLADALLEGHAKVPEKDTFSIKALPIPIPVVDQDSYEWTQKSATMFGDILIPVWKKPLEEAPSITATHTVTCEGVRMELAVSPALDGTVRLYADGEFYEADVKAGVGAIVVPGQPKVVEAGIVAEGRLYGKATFSF